MIRGGINNINGKYLRYTEKYDNYDVYYNMEILKSEGKILYVYHFTYPELERWYIGDKLGRGGRIFGYIDDYAHNLRIDLLTQSWTEHIESENEWRRNVNLKINWVNFDEQKFNQELLQFSRNKDQIEEHVNPNYQKEDVKPNEQYQKMMEEQRKKQEHIKRQQMEQQRAIEIENQRRIQQEQQR